MEKHWHVISTTIPIDKDGVARPGGSQGNYKEVLNTVLTEYLLGDKELARQIYRTVRIGAHSMSMVRSTTTHM